MGPVNQLALGGHDEGQGHAGLAGALGARVRHGHGIHASSGGCGTKRVEGHGVRLVGNPGEAGIGLRRGLRR